MLGNDCASMSSGKCVGGSPVICGFSGALRGGLLVGRREVTDVRSYACVDARFGMGFFRVIRVVRVIRGSSSSYFKTIHELHELHELHET